MKKIFVLTLLVLKLCFAFGQTNYGNWTPSPCYNYIQFQMKYNGKSSVTSGNQRVEQGWYSIRIRNTSSKKVALSYIVTMNSNREVLRHSSSSNAISAVRIEGGAPDTRLNPNEIIERDVYLTKTFQSVVYFEVWALKFESNNGATINQNYENCSNGKPCMECQEHPNQMSCNSNSKINQTKNSNQQTTQQNDLSEYNRSKADLERQMAERNAEGQQKSQNYTQAMNAGITAHNSGNYAEAKRQFSIALNNCNTEDARLKAQEYYNKTVDAEKNKTKLNTINKVGNIAIDLAKNIKTRKWDNGNLVGDNNLFNDFTKDVIIELGKVGFKYSHLDNVLEEKFVKSTELNNNIIERKRQLYFYYNDKDLITTDIKCRYISLGNGTYFDIKLNYGNSSKIVELLKSNNPFKKFKSAYSSRKYDYMGKDMVNYTNRVNQFDVEIFKQENLGENTLSKVETSINELKTNNDNLVKELLEADNFFEVEDGELNVIGGDYDKIYLNAAKAIILYNKNKNVLSSKQYFNWAIAFRNLMSRDEKTRDDLRFENNNAYLNTLIEASEKGSKDANNLIADFYSREDLYSEVMDIEKAIQYYQKQEKNNDFYATLRLAQIHNPMNSHSDRDSLMPLNFKDVNKSILYFQKATQLSKDKSRIADIYNNLGEIYLDYKGKDLKSDPKKALQYYETALQLGDVTSNQQLGEIYELGKGVPIDLKKAKKYYIDLCNSFVDMNETEWCKKVKLMPE